MTLPALRALTRRLLNEQTAADSFWTDADLDDYLNRADELFYALTEISQGETLLSSVASDIDYDLSAITNAPVIRPKRAFFLDPADSKFKRLKFRTIEELDLEDAAWFTKVADAGAIPGKFAFQGSLLYLIPAPVATGTNNIRLWSVLGPLVDLVGTASPAFPGVYHQALSYGAAVAALEQDRVSTGATAGIGRLEKRFYAFVALAGSQNLQKGPPRQMRDIRDFFGAEYRA